MALFTENADVSVRPAIRGDEQAIARIQLGAWRVSHADVLAGALDLLDEPAVEAQWATAVSTPPGAGFRVLVACEGATVVGVVSLAPVPAPEGRPFDAPGGVILTLEVEPSQQRGGHGSRLLAAAVDTLREDGADQVHTWVLDGDSARAQFLASSGLGPDEVSRSLPRGPCPMARRASSPSTAGLPRSRPSACATGRRRAATRGALPSPRRVVGERQVVPGAPVVGFGLGQLVVGPNASRATARSIRPPGERGKVVDRQLVSGRQRVGHALHVDRERPLPEHQPDHDQGSTQNAMPRTTPIGSPVPMSAVARAATSQT